jgi:hypothetical protein
MKRKAILLVQFIMVVIPILNAQTKNTPAATPKVEVYYFHPTERCPIDESIEVNIGKVMKTDFAKEIRNGIIRFQVLNTDDPLNAKVVSKFDINAQALYIVKIVKGKEIKTDLTTFAFDSSLNNAQKFKGRLKDEIESALK